MKPYHLRASTTAVEVWSGYRIQFDGMERHAWQKGSESRRFRYPHPGNGRSSRKISAGTRDPRVLTIPQHSDATGGFPLGTSACLVALTKSRRFQNVHL
jgi:hypothetical protein